LPSQAVILAGDFSLNQTALNKNKNEKAQFRWAWDLLSVFSVCLIISPIKPKTLTLNPRKKKKEIIRQ